MHPDRLKEALLEMAHDFKVEALIMDMHRAEDIAAWIEDELGIEVVDGDATKTQSHVNQYEAFMDGLRNGTLKHTGDHGLRAHVLNGIARRLPRGDYRFDRPNVSRGSAQHQDKRVIDALSAAAMAVEFSNRIQPPSRSVYEDRELVAA